MTPLPSSFFDCLELYTTSFDAVCFHPVRTDFNKLQTRDRFDKRHDTAVAGWAELWNYCDGHSALDCRCVDEETNSPFVRCYYRESMSASWSNCFRGCMGKVRISAISII